MKSYSSKFEAGDPNIFMQNSIKLSLFTGYIHIIYLLLWPESTTLLKSERLFAGHFVVAKDRNSLKSRLWSHNHSIAGGGGTVGRWINSASRNTRPPLIPNTRTTPIHCTLLTTLSSRTNCSSYPVLAEHDQLNR